MSTYYARNVTGNWASTTSWDSASSGGAGPAGPPVAGDTAIFDSGFTGNITIAANAQCATLTVQAGATGTLTWSSTNSLVITTAATFVSGFNLSGATGTFTLNGATVSLTTGGLTIPGNLTFFSSGTYTLGNAVNVAGRVTLYASIIFAGAYDITCDTLSISNFNAGSATIQLVSGQTLTVTTALYISMYAWNSSILTIRSTVASSDAFLHYNGTAANLKVAVATFTDINCAHAIDNWYGGTLTRTTGITNRTSADIGQYAKLQLGL